MGLFGVVANLQPNGTKKVFQKRSVAGFVKWLLRKGTGVPLLFLDGNAHVGLDKIPSTQYLHTPSQSPSGGRANAAPEN